MSKLKAFVENCDYSCDMPYGFCNKKLKFGSWVKSKNFLYPLVGDIAIIDWN